MENIISLSLKKQATQKNRKFPKYRLLVISTLMILGLLLIFVAFFLAKLNAPCALNGEVSFPLKVKRGEYFDIAILVTNPTRDPIYINHVVLHRYANMPTLLDGARVISTEPIMAPEPMQLFPSDIQFYYFRYINSGESQRILFHLQAEKPGVYVGNIGIYTEDLECAFHYQNAEIKILP